MVQHADIDHTGLTGVGGGGGGIIGADRNAYTGGNITLNNTTLSAVSGPTDLVVPATAGDWIMVGVSCQPTSTTSASIAFDFATMVGGSPNRYVAADSSTPFNVPIPWYIGAGETSACNGGLIYQVDAGDVSGGNVTLRLYFRTSASRSVNASSTAPLTTWVINYGQP